MSINLSICRIFAALLMPTAALLTSTNSRAFDVQGLTYYPALTLTERIGTLKAVAAEQLPVATDPGGNAGMRLWTEQYAKSTRRADSCDSTDSVCDGLKRTAGDINPTTAAPIVHHYEYVFPDGNIDVYDLDNRFKLVKHVRVPTFAGVRGCVASAATGKLYISYGSDNTSGGSLLEYDLSTDVVVWQRTYAFGIDSMSISPGGKLIYMPTGERTANGIWEVLDATTGDVLGSIDSQGIGPHNTVVSPTGKHLYMGPKSSDYLVVADTSSNVVTKQIGPVLNGVRPFTINGRETLAFITTTGFLGFQVGDILNSKIIYTARVRGFPTSGGAASDPSHGISLSPDENEIYLIDSINSYVHVFDVSGLPLAAPKRVADIPLVGNLSGNESDCAYDCVKDGWLHHSIDGRYVLVGDSGDVIDTRLRKTVARLPAMANTRKEIEIDFQNSRVVWAMKSRSSIGRRH